jgi:hypothetical protein
MDKSPTASASQKGGKETFRSQNHRFFKVFKMGCKSGTCKEKEWRNKVVHRFLESEQSIPQGQLPTPKDGLYPAEGSWVLEDVYAGWIFRLQSGHGTPR